MAWRSCRIRARHAWHGKLAHLTDSPALFFSFFSYSCHGLIQLATFDLILPLLIFLTFYVCYCLCLGSA